LDEAAIADAVRYQNTVAGRPAAHIVTSFEDYLLPAARLREELRLPGQTVADTLPFRDKVAMKAHLAQCGVRIPAFGVFSRDRAMELLAASGAVIAKPRLSKGAMDVVLITSEAELRAFEQRHASRLGEFEVEQFIDGAMFHIDSVVRDGVVIAASVSRYLEPPTSYQTVTPCRSVNVPAGPEHDLLVIANQRVIASFPGFTGVMHHEVFLAHGEVWFCEIGARPGGAGVPVGFHARTGINLHEACLQAQVTGDVPLPTIGSADMTGWIAIYAPTGILRAPIRIPDEEWVIDANVFARAGDRRRRPARASDVVALASVRGRTESEVIDRLELVKYCARPDVS
jgi:biotin carboxylase